MTRANLGKHVTPHRRSRQVVRSPVPQRTLVNAPESFAAEMQSLATRLLDESKQAHFSVSPIVLRAVAERLMILSENITQIAQPMSAPTVVIAPDEVWSIQRALGTKRKLASLLAAVAATPGTVQSHQALQMALGARSASVIKVYMTHLRALLRAAGLDAVIRTEHGHGYWISPHDAARVAMLWRPSP